MQQPFANGSFIDKRYSIQKQLADNLCNYCYLALDSEQTDRSVILSFPKTELLIIPGFNAAFKDGWQHLSRARLNGLVKIIGGGVYESHPYAIIQHTNHPTLQQLLKEAGGTQSPEAVLNWATPLAVILDELHQADYVHSHLRPDSVQIGTQQQIIIGDFITEFALQRLGKFKDALTTLNASDYLSPEFIKSNYSGSYDQYLLATLIYWALSGKAPFYSDLGEDYRMRVATIRVPSLPGSEDYSGSFVEVLDKALERNPIKRFDDCREFVNNLRDAIQSQPKLVEMKAVEIESIEEKPKDDSTKTVGMKAVVIETVVAKPKVTRLKTAASDADPIIAERAYEEPVEKAGKQHLLWWLLVLVGVAGAAYMVLTHNADQITSNNVRNEPVAAELGSSAVMSIADQQGSDGMAAADRAASAVQGADSAVDSNVAANSTDVVAAGVVEGQPGNSNEGEVTQATALNGLGQTASEDPVADPEQLPLDAMVSDAAETDPTSDDTGASAQSTDTAVAIGQTENPESAGPDANGLPVDENTGEVNADAANGVTESDGQPATGETISAVGTEGDQSLDNESAPEAPRVVDTRFNAVSPQGEEQLLASEIAAAQALLNETNTPPASTVTSADDFGAASDTNLPNPTTEVVPEVTSQPAAVVQPPARSRNSSPPSSIATVQTPVAQSRPVVAQAAPQTERERIRAVKARELARIKSITDDCVIGGKMHREAAAGNLGYVKNCMSVGVSPDITQSNRWTMLHIAARSGHLNMAKLLVAQGAQVNAKAADGSTPLDMAVAARHPSLERFILSRGGVRAK